MTRIRRGDIWWYEPLDAKSRPVCVITRDPAIDVLNRVIVVPATTRGRSLPTEVQLGRSLDGMPRDCVLSLDNTQVVDKALLTRRMTRLRPAKMREVCRALAIATGCS